MFESCHRRFCIILDMLYHVVRENSVGFLLRENVSLKQGLRYNIYFDPGEVIDVTVLFNEKD